jgi:hypothetical protein
MSPRSVVIPAKAVVRANSVAAEMLKWPDGDSKIRSTAPNERVREMPGPTNVFSEALEIE